MSNEFNNPQHQPFEMALIQSREAAEALSTASAGLIPEVTVTLVDDTERALGIFAQQAHRDNQAGLKDSLGRPFLESVFRDNARRALENGQVIVQIVRPDGIGDLSHLHKAVREQANSSDT